MVNEEKYFDELQKILGKTKSADKINEQWGEVLKRLDELAVEYCNELQTEVPIRYEKEKGSAYDLNEFPPYRLLAMNLILSRWVGWISAPKKLHYAADCKRIEDAYNNGKSAYTEYKKAEYAAKNAS
jgi:hypothetical protein